MDRLHIVVKVSIVEHIDIELATARSYAQYNMSVVTCNFVLECAILSYSLRVGTCCKEILNPEWEWGNIIENIVKHIYIWLTFIHTTVQNYARIELVLLHL